VQAGSAVPVGFVLFVVAWIFLIVIGFGFPYSTKYSSVAVVAFSLLPWSLLAKGINDLAAASEARLGGITWQSRETYCQTSVPSPTVQAQLNFWQQDCVMSLSQIFVCLALQCAVYMLLAVYVDNVLPDVNGARKSVLYFCFPSYWFPQKVSHSMLSRLANSAAWALIV
jgi:hypothetical protein